MRLLMFICLSLLSSHCLAGVSPRLDSLRSEVLIRANLPNAGTDQVSQGDVERIINAKILQVCVDFPAIEKLDTIEVDSSSVGGAVASDFDRARFVQRMFDYGDEEVPIRLALLPTNPDSLKHVTPSAEGYEHNGDDDNEPAKYYFASGYLMLHPKWSRSDTGEYLVSYFATDTTLTDDASETSVDGRYLDAVVAAATAEVNRILGRWDDAGRWQGLYEMFRARHGGISRTPQGDAIQTVSSKGGLNPGQ